MGMGEHDRSDVEAVLLEGGQYDAGVVAGVDNERVVVAIGVHEPAVGFQWPDDDAVKYDAAIAMSGTNGVRSRRHGG